MGSTTLTTLADVINEQAEQTLLVLKDNVEARRATGLGVASEFFPMKVAPVTDGNLRWSVLTTGGTADSFDLATGAYPAAQNQQYDEAALAFKGIVQTFRIMQHTLNAMKGGVLRGIGDLIAHNVEEAVRDMMLEVETQLQGAGSGNDIAGIQSFIQASTTYAGIDSSTAAYWKPYMNALSAVWSEDAMDTHLENQRGTTYRSPANKALTGYGQFHKIAKVLKGNGVYQLPQTEIVAGTTGILYEGISIYPVAGYSETRIDFIDPAVLSLEILQALTTVELGRTGHYREFSITLECNSKCRSPRNCSGMTSVS